MAQAVLTFNAGSSSIKFALFESTAGTVGRQVFRGQIEDLDEDPAFCVRDGSGRIVAEQTLGRASGRYLTHAQAMTFLLGWIDAHDDDWRLVGVGHRVVHGGTRFVAPVRVDPAALAQIEALAPLAPLHQPHNCAGIRALAGVRPDLPQVACFDTAFHATLPAEERLYALPRAWTEAGIRRYGFHGLSYEHVAGELPGLLGPAADGRVIVAHLGNGASMCALHGRRSVATTMGFTALDGLMMGTRCGALDPGAVLHLIEQMGVAPREVARQLYHRSGLLGVSGISHDMRTLLASDAPRARQAIDLYVRRVVRETGSLTAALGGLDAIVFTAGIGEHAAPIRARVLGELGWLGVEIDEAANARHGPRLTASTSRVGAWVIPTNEERMVARHTLAVLGARVSTAPRSPAAATFLLPCRSPARSDRS